MLKNVGVRELKWRVASRLFPLTHIKVSTKLLISQSHLPLHIKIFTFMQLTNFNLLNYHYII